jgi:hypothetical protein
MTGTVGTSQLGYIMNLLPLNLNVESLKDEQSCHHQPPTSINHVIQVHPIMLA